MTAAHAEPEVRSKQICAPGLQRASADPSLPRGGHRQVGMSSDTRLLSSRIGQDANKAWPGLQQDCSRRDANRHAGGRFSELAVFDTRLYIRVRRINEPA